MSTSHRSIRNVFPFFKSHWTWRTAKSSAVAIMAAIFVNDHVLEITGINGVSMAPTLSPEHNTTGRKDYVTWKTWSPTRNLQRGDVVHFANPVRPESFAVKRVIALEGDTVILYRRRKPKPENGIVEGTSAAEKAWTAWRGRVQVPPGHVWVEGDNWRSSKDSNHYGPVSKSLITGRAWLIAGPRERWFLKPWEGFDSATKVVVGTGRRGKEWTVDGLPVELMEVSEEKVLPELETSTPSDMPKGTTDLRDKCQRGRWSG